MTSCQISLAAIYLFLAFVFLKQKTWSEGTYNKKKFKCGRPLKMMRGLLYKIQHKTITSFAEGNMLVLATCMQCLSQKKHFAGSRIGSCRAYKRTLAVGKEDLNFEDL